MMNTLSCAIGLPELAVPCEIRGGSNLWQSAAAKLVVGSLYYLRDGQTPQAASRLGTNKRGEILREQLDTARTTVRGNSRWRAGT
jgi:DNA helicase II / ATP-dependent DNA helicase PcrA